MKKVLNSYRQISQPLFFCPAASCLSSSMRCRYQLNPEVLHLVTLILRHFRIFTSTYKVFFFLWGEWLSLNIETINFYDFKMSYTIPGTVFTLKIPCVFAWILVPLHSYAQKYNQNHLRFADHLDVKFSWSWPQ